MTPNGALLFLALCTVSLFFPTRFVLPVFALVPVAVLVASLSPVNLMRALRQALVLTTPLFLFLLLVWVVVARMPPKRVIFVSSGLPLTAIEYVVGIASRLFLFTLLIGALVQRFLLSGAVAFVRLLSLPDSIKALILTTLSLKHTIAQAAARAHTALVAARVLTTGVSWANGLQGWRLVQGVWMSTLNMALERLDTKWKLEGLPEGFALRDKQQVVVLGSDDLLWGVLPASALLLASIYG